MLQIAFISEQLCIGCGICPKRCPFEVRGEQPSLSRF
jgi:translation initiation factor RLI1